MLAGYPAPADAPAGYEKVAVVLSAVSGAPGEAELAGQHQAMAAFRAATAAGGVTPRTRSHRRKAMLSSLVSAKLAIAAAAAAAPLAGVTAASFTGSLPAPLQNIAHDAIGAPKAPAPAGPGSDQQAPLVAPALIDPSTSPTDSVSPTATDSSTPSTDPASDSPTDSPSVMPTAVPTAGPVGPDATGPAAFGLCNAWSHGGLGTASIAYRNLAAAAGGTDGIGTYCAGVTGPGHSAAPGNDATPTLSPSASPAALGATHGKSATASGKSASHKPSQSAAHGAGHH